MRLVHNSDNHQPPARRETPQWVTVAEVALWGDRYDEAIIGDNMVAPYGVLTALCHRAPGTSLEDSRYLLQLEQDGKPPVLVDCSQDDLRNLALALLDAAEHAYPLELKRAGYEQCIAPWFDGNNGGGVA